MDSPVETYARTLVKLFRTNVHFEVPKFQRRYVWEKQNWTSMWEDVMNAARRESQSHARQGHFLGAIVLEPQPSRSTNTDVFRIVDGQQRLTTLQLLISAAREVATRYGDNSSAATSLDWLSVNRDETAKGPDAALKVWPTLADKRPYRRSMTRNSAALRTEFSGALPTIVQAYLFFVERITEWLQSFDTARREAALGRLVDALNVSLHVVVIELSGDDNPQAIFESLNARGLPLQASDLVRNYLFRAAEEQDLDAESLYAEHWQRFEDGRWREETARENKSYPHMDAFLSDFLTVELRDNVSPQQIFLTFRDYIDTAIRDDTAGLTLPEMMERLAAYGDIYHSLDSATGKGVSPYEREFLLRLKSLDTGAVMPVLLKIFVDLDQDGREPVLRVLDSYLWRRAIAQLPAKNYGDLMLKLLTVLDDAGPKPVRAVTDFLTGQDAASNYWPSDDDMRTATTVRAIDRMKSSRLRQVLGIIDAKLATERSEIVVRADTPGLSIEHLMPLSSRHWPRRGVSAQRREQAVHTLGNLTLLTRKLNREVGNGLWPAKRRKILDHSALTLNRDLPNSWDEGRIDERGRRFAQILIDYFARPTATSNATETPEPEPDDDLPTATGPADDVAPANDVATDGASTDGASLASPPTPALLAARQRTVAGHILAALSAPGAPEIMTVSQLARAYTDHYPGNANSNTIRDRLKRGTVSGVETTTNDNGYLAARLSPVAAPGDRMTQATSRLKPPGDVPPLQRQFHAAMIRLCDQARSRAKFPLHGLRAMINAKGGLMAAQRLLAEPRVSDTFAELARRGHLGLTVETLVLRPEFATLFNDEEKAVARNRLAHARKPDDGPAGTPQANRPDR